MVLGGGGQYFLIMSNGVICVPSSVSLSTASLLSVYERTMDSMVSLHTESVICRLISLFIFVCFYLIPMT